MARELKNDLDQGETERLNESRVDEDALQGAISYG